MPPLQLINQSVLIARFCNCPSIFTLFPQWKFPRTYSFTLMVTYFLQILSGVPLVPNSGVNTTVDLLRKTLLGEVFLPFTSDV